MDDHNLIIEIIVKQALRQPLKEEEVRLLEEWLEQSDDHRALAEQFRDMKWVAEQRRRLNETPSDEMWENIRQHIERSGVAAPAVVMGHRRRITRAWRYVAVFIGAILVGGGVAWWVGAGRGNHEQAIVLGVIKPLMKKVVEAAGQSTPNIYKVLLIGSDGRVYDLDSVRVGQVAVKEGDMVLRKTDSNQLAYTGTASYPNRFRLSIGRLRGAFQLRFPDGSKVWLNRASCLDFPVKWRAGGGSLKVEGECWFNIAPNPSRPLAVTIGRGTVVRVLGTSFDVRAYPGEAHDRVSLLSGTVEVSGGQGIGKTLQANEEAVIGGEGTVKVRAIEDPAAVLAWVELSSGDHMFSFENTNYLTVMREVADWYGVVVSNPDSVRGVPITGKMSGRQPLRPMLDDVQRVESGYARMQLRNDSVFIMARK